MSSLSFFLGCVCLFVCVRVIFPGVYVCVVFNCCVCVVLISFGASVSRRMCDVSLFDDNRLVSVLIGFASDCENCHHYHDYHHHDYHHHHHHHRNDHNKSCLSSSISL